MLQHATTLIYNVRLDPNRDGAMPKTRIRKLKPKFAILYEEGHEMENKYHIFRIHDYAVMSEDRMRLAQYPREPEGDYFIFRFDEEIRINSRFEINRLIEDRKNLDGNYVYGEPIYITGRDLYSYKPAPGIVIF